MPNKIMLSLNIEITTSRRGLLYVTTWQDLSGESKAGFEDATNKLLDKVQDLIWEREIELRIGVTVKSQNKALR